MLRKRQQRFCVMAATVLELCIASRILFSVEDNFIGSFVGSFVGSPMGFVFSEYSHKVSSTCIS